MFRKTLTILSLIGLLLSVGAWGVSYFYFQFSYMSARKVVCLEEGCLRWGPYPYSGVPLVRNADGGFEVAKYSFRFGGFIGFATDWLPNRRLLLSLPLWMPASLFAILPCYHFLPSHRRRKRRNLGLCVACGYDLRGSAERCPECGKAFS
jgi:hypothetical protein